MDKNKKYFAFISYKSEDVEWAIWLQHELEHYHLPASYNGRTDVRQNLRPIFRDIDELSAGNLPQQIHQALVDSQNLIVVCSPKSATSPWVNQEIETFIALGRTDYIFPFIVEGNSPKEFFPQALLTLPSSQERLGGDVSKNGRDAAFVKIVAGMLSVGFDSLWNRYEKEKAEKERLEREQRDNLLKIQSRFIAEKALAIADRDSDLACLLAIEALVNPKDRPYTPEAEKALRSAIGSNNTCLSGYDDPIEYISFSKDGKYLISLSNGIIRIWDVQTKRVLKTINVEYAKAVYWNEEQHILIALTIDRAIRKWNIDTGMLLDSKNMDFCLLKSAVFSPKGTYVALIDWTEEDNLVFDVESGRLVNKLPGHSNDINFISFSNDEKYIVSASEDKTVRVWDIKKGSECLSIEHAGSVNSAAFSEDRSKIITTCDDNTMQLFDANNGTLIRTYNGLSNAARYAIFNPDGRLIASTSMDHSIFLWNVETGALKRIIKEHTEEVTCLAFSSDGKYLASASKDKTILIKDIQNCHLDSPASEESFKLFTPIAICPNGKLFLSSVENRILVWNAKTNTILRVLTKQTGDVTYLDFSPDGSSFLSAYTDGTIIIWNARTGRIRRILTGHSDEVFCAVFSPNGEQMISSSKDKTIHVWDVNSGSVKHTIHELACSLSFSPDGKDFISSALNSPIILWNVDSLKKNLLADSKSADLLRVTYSHNGKLVAALYFASSIIKIWDSQSRELLMCIPISNYNIWGIAFSPDDRHIAVSSSEEGLLIWEVHSGKLVKQIKYRDDFTGWFDSIVYSPDGKRLFTINRMTNTIAFCTSNSNTLNLISSNLFSQINHMALSPEGNNIALVYDNIIEFKDTTSGLTNMCSIGHSDKINSIDYSPEGKIVVTASDDYTLRLWETKSGREIKSLKKENCIIYNAIFSPDGRNIVATLRKIKTRKKFKESIVLWNIENDKFEEIKSNLYGINHIAFSLDGSKIVATDRNAIRVFNIEDKKEVVNIKGYGNLLSSTFYSDNERVVSIGENGLIITYLKSKRSILVLSECFSDVSTLSVSGKFVVARGKDRTINVWSIPDGINISSVLREGSGITKLAVNLRGTKIAMVEGNDLRIYDFPSIQEVIAQTKERLNYRTLSPEERRKYYLE